MIRFIGKTILNIIPRVEDYAHIQRIINPDGTSDHVILHSGEDQQDEAMQLKAKSDVTKVLDVSTGTYDVTVSVGPSYQTKRQEAVASIMALVQAAPAVLNVVGDLLVGNMDWNNATEIAARLKKMLPPQLQDDDSEDPQVKLQKTQGQLQAMSVMTQNITQALAKANQIIQTKQLENESRERIAAMNNEAGMIEAAFKANAEGALQAMNAQMEALHKRLDLLHDSMSLDQEARNEMLVNAHAATLPTPAPMNGTGAPPQ
jgi:Phage P22-like portal protein